VGWSVRGRLALVLGVLLVGTVAVFGTLLLAVRRAQTRADTTRATLAQAQQLATRLTQAAILGEREEAPLTRLVDTTLGLTATERMRSLMEGVPDYVYVLDQRGRTIYNSYAVRTLRERDRATLDSLAVGFPVRAAGTRLRTGEGELQFHAVDLPGAPAGISRVVVGRVLPGGIGGGEVIAAMILLIPLVALASVAGAGVVGRVALAPVEQVIDEVEAITDGRSLHRRVHVDESVGDEFTRLSGTLNAMIARLETSFAALRRFTADASHELKTPLTVLRADVERAMATTGQPAEQLVALEEALAETTRMADLVNGLLTLARADEGRLDLYREPVDLAALAQDVYETAQLLGEPARVTVVLDPLPALSVPGDRERLRQLFLNLITNAIKYTPAEGTVTLSLAQDAALARFTVRDTGMGIAAADLPHVFERFWRADRVRTRGGERGGFGLGLPISQYIAQAHGGALSVQSRLGRGSAFTVTLPLGPLTTDPTEK
jgi:two-component system, OmpR family, sensor kinase